MRKRSSDFHMSFSFFRTELRDRFSDSVRSDERQLAISRIFIAFFLLVFDPLENYGWMDQIPTDFFNPPPGVARIFISLPFRLPFAVVDSILRILCLLLLFGVRVRLTGVAIGFILLYANSFLYSLGYINHKYIILTIAMICLSLGSEWGKSLALVPDSTGRIRDAVWGTRALALCIVVGMFISGFGKSLSWIDFDLGTSGFLSWHVKNSRFEHVPVVGKWLVSQSPFLLETVDYGTVLMECSPLFFILLGRGWWLGWLLFANLFHLIAFLTLHISFLSQSLIYLAFNVWTHEGGFLQSFLKNRWMVFLFAATALVSGFLRFSHSDNAHDILIVFAYCVIIGLQIRGIWIYRLISSSSK
jgi:hypothetical protein